MTEPLLSLADMRAATGLPWSSTAYRSSCPSTPASRCLAGTVSASRPSSSPSWATPRSPWPHPLAWRGHHRLAPHRRALAGIGWVAQEREIFLSLRVEENLTVASRHGRWNFRRSTTCFPVSPSAAQFRQSLLRRRAADAGDRARADDQSGATAARRTARRLAPIVVEELATAIRRMTAKAAPLSSWSSTADIALSLTSRARDRARPHRPHRPFGEIARRSGGARPARRTAAGRGVSSVIVSCPRREQFRPTPFVDAVQPLAPHV